MVQIDQNLSPLPATATQPLIRPARIHDVDQLTDVLTASFYADSGWLQWVYPFMRLSIQEDLKQRLRSQSPRYVCLAAVPTSAEGSGRTPAIAGTAEAALRQPWPWQGDRHVYISNLAVEQGFRRQGVATALLQSCEHIAQRWQVDELRLHVMADNLAAQALYRKAGFQTVQAEDSPASWLGLQARRLLLRKHLPPMARPS